jgi:pimeloyl-ACP methyl ester carboxylesterase
MDMTGWNDRFLEANGINIHYVRHGESAPILKVEWADRLGDYFTDLDFSPVREAGHFVHYERPDLANREIQEFFSERTR